MDSRADDCIREWEHLAARRGVWENHWREVAERVRPNQNLFQRRERPDGDKRMEKVFDSTAPLALPKFAAAVISMAFPANQRYQKLVASDPSLDKQADVRRYLDGLTDLLFRVRYAPQANFITQSGEVILDIGAFGTGILFVDDVLGIGLRYKSFPLAETWIAEDGHGRVDTLYRKFPMTAHQAVTMFGMSALPESIQRAYEKDRTQKFDFLHVVKPNPERDSKRRDYRGMEFWSCYIAFEDRQAISEGGYRVFPFAVPRYETGNQLPACNQAAERAEKDPVARRAAGSRSPDHAGRRWKSRRVQHPAQRPELWLRGTGRPAARRAVPVWRQGGDRNRDAGARGAGDQ